MKKSACSYCGGFEHTSLQCFQKPRKAIQRVGKRTKSWLGTRKEWIDENPPDEHGYYYCFYCGSPLTIDKNKLEIGIMFMTLDHKYGRKGDLLFDKNHLVPSCYPDNRLKGSQDYGRFVERHYPHLLEKEA